MGNRKRKKTAGKKAGRLAGRTTETMTVICTAVLLALVVLAFLVPVFSPYPYDAQNISEQNLPVSMKHLFGTDRFGRDLFTRSFYGLRISMTVGIVSAAVSMTVGTFLGVAAGYFGGAADVLIAEVMNVVGAVPSMLYVILIMLILEPGCGSVIIGICISGWIDVARIVRSETKRIRQMDYCTAAEAMGLPRSRIIRKYVLGNERALLTAQTILFIPKAIFTEAFLSFIGIGIAAPQASLGALIQDAKSQMAVCPWQMIFPVILLVLVILCLQSAGGTVEKISGTYAQSEAAR